MNKLEIQSELFQVIFRLKYVLRKSYVAGELHPGAFHLLHLIEKNEKKLEISDKEEYGTSITLLSEKMHVSKPAVSRMVKELEKKEYVVRITSQSDKRMVFVTTTSKGKNEIAKAKEEAIFLISQMGEKLGESDSKELIRLLNRLHDIVNEIKIEREEECKC